MKIAGPIFKGWCGLLLLTSDTVFCAIAKRVCLGRGSAIIRFELSSRLRAAFAFGNDIRDVPCLFLADSVAKVPKCRGTNFPQKDETSDNWRSIQRATEVAYEFIAR
jgi:hypothetical protein